MITKDTPIQDIPFGYHQQFEKPFTLSVNKVQTIKAKGEHIISSVDIEIARFVFEHKFVTEQQLLALAEIYSEGLTAKQLQRLLQTRVLNRFSLSKDEHDEFNPKGMVIYCLDLGGKFLLERYSNESVLNWVTSDNMYDSGLISKILMTSEVMIVAHRNLADKLEYIRANSLLRLSREEFNLSAEMELTNPHVSRYVLVQTIVTEDFPIRIRETVEFLSDLLESKGWKKYYHHSQNEPFLLFVTDDMNTAKLIGRMMDAGSNIERYRITVMDMMEETFKEDGKMFRYDGETDELKGVKAPLFN